MKEKIESAIRIIERALESKERPAIMFSGGKDSMALLHLMRFGLDLDFDVIFHREPWHTHKYAFGEYIARRMGLRVYDYPPSALSLWHGKGIIAFTNYYQIGVMQDGRPACLALPKNIIECGEDSETPYLCGKVEIMQRPTGAFSYPWDVAFIGHKSSDEDQIAGKVPLHLEIVDNDAGPRLAFPLREWTDADVWEYTREKSLPIQTDRYDPIARKELQDKTNNSDYFPACIRCIDRRITDKEVMCPKLQKLVPNVSDRVPYTDIKLSYFGETPCKD